MNATFKTLSIIAGSCLFLGLAQAGAEEAGESTTASAPGPIEKTGNAIEHGAKAAASGIERGTKAAVRGVKRGAAAAAGGIERGAQATGRAAQKVATKVGIAKPADTAAENGKP